MKAYAAAAVTVCLFGYTLASYAQVTCYDCSYNRDGSSINGHSFDLGCKEPFDGSQIETGTCSGQCVTKKEISNFVSYIRYCEPECQDMDKEYMNNGMKVTYRFRCCTGDLCNGAGSLSHASTLVTSHVSSLSMLGIVVGIVYITHQMGI